MTYLNLVNDLITAVVAILGMFGIHKAGWLSFMQKEAPVVGQFVHDLAQFPAVKAVEGALHVKLSHVEGKLAESELTRLALVGIHAFNCHLSSLSEAQMGSLVVFIRQELPRDTKITDNEILVAIHAAQRAVDRVADSDLFDLATKLTAVQTQVTTPAPVASAEPLVTPSTVQVNLSGSGQDNVNTQPLG